MQRHCAKKRTRGERAKIRRMVVLQLNDPGFASRALFQIQEMSVLGALLRKEVKPKLLTSSLSTQCEVPGLFECLSFSWIPSHTHEQNTARMRDVGKCRAYVRPECCEVGRKPLSGGMMFRNKSKPDRDVQLHATRINPVREIPLSVAPPRSRNPPSSVHRQSITTMAGHVSHFAP